MNSVYEALCRLFSTLQVYKQKLHGFHWHVTGVEYYQLHLLFDRLYGALQDYEDRIAEHIREYGFTLMTYAEYLSLSSIREVKATDDVQYLLAVSVEDLGLLRAGVQKSNEVTTQAKKYGTLNLLGELDETLDTMFYLLASNKKGFNL